MAPFETGNREGGENPDSGLAAILSFLVFLGWTLVPSFSMWLGLYVIKNAVWTFVFYHGLCLAPTIYLLRRHWLDTWKVPSRRGGLFIFLGAVAFCLLALLVYELLGPILLSNDAVLALLIRLGYCKEIFWPLSLYAILVNPLVEELYWRGCVLNKLDAMPHPLKHFGIIWSSFAYAFFHYWIFRLVLFPGFAELATFELALYGIFLALVYRRSGSILTTALTHGLFTDLAVIVLLLDLFRRYPGVL